MNNQIKRMISILLTLSILAAFAMAPMVSAAEETRTVYFDNSSKKWSQVYAYTWDANNTATNGTWPGTAMTLVKDSVYAIDIPVGSVNIIFTNNAGTQTADLVLPTDGTNLFSVNEKWETYSPDDDSQEPNETQPTTSPQIQYIVAGDAALCGSEWDPTDTRNLMTDENGDRVYEIWYPDVAPGTYELKITDGTWNNSWGKYASQDNYVLQVSFRSKVKISFNSVQKHIVSNVIKLEDTETDPVVPTSVDYYLVGYINGANYGCEEDSANMGEYKFVDGKLVATFEQDSYVFLKKTNNAQWYLAESYCTDTVCTFKAGMGSEKMFVPGNVELTFTLTENTDGSVTLSYAEVSTKVSTVPTLTLKAPTLEFKDMITVNAFYTADNTEDVVEMGMITYSSSVSSWSVDNAQNVIPGATYDDASGRYYSCSQGIHAKYLGDTVYLAVYAKLADGTYAYSKLASYSAVTYATNQLKNSTDTKLKQLVAAMLNYGAEAQLYFGHNTSALANSSMTSAQKVLPATYNSSMVNSVPTASAAKQGSFANNQGFASRKPAISFEGAFCINYFFTPNYIPDSGIALYYWNATDYAANSVLTTANATGSLQMTGEGTGEYRGDITGIAAKALSEAVYVAAVYTSNGTTWTSGVLGYSIGAYCSSQASKGSDVANLAKATAVYGYHAKQYFG